MTQAVTQQAVLVLANGAVFRGRGVGAPGRAVGEVVFNTAMSGYQEILSDPSYRRQIVTLTLPHVGNTGVNDEDMESADARAAGLVLRDLPLRHSSWRAKGDLSSWLRERGVPAIAGVDTRRLTRILRDQGAQAGCLMSGDVDEAEALEAARAFPGLAGMDLAREVSCTAPFVWNGGVHDAGGAGDAGGAWQETGGFRPAGEGRHHVVALDFGVKRNILRLLVDRGCRVTVLPATSSVDTVLALEPDGVFLSNGPGDPEPCTYAIDTIRTLLGRGVPLFGICLGHQLLALASGARTVKMKFGHHGANHPVKELDTGRVLITSQNHGFAVDEDSLPDSLRTTHRSLFDGSLQGIERTDVPAFGFQGHPEASPGPHDVAGLFDRFAAMMDRQPTDPRKT